MLAILRGIAVRQRDTIGGFGLFADQRTSPAFLSTESSLLAPYLSRALAKASPRDMVTFYMVPEGDRVTSGGLFLRGRHLYFILANARTSLYGNQYENAHTVDTRDQPLLPIVRYQFSAAFTPEGAWIPNKQVRGRDGYDRYLDESKLLVIDLDRLGPAGKDQPQTPLRR
jgi:hypothetical protein